MGYRIGADFEDVGQSSAGATESYDANGNMTVLTNPSNRNHGFVYNNVNLSISYAPPVSGATGYVYDWERRLAQMNFPSGRSIRNVYTATRLTQI